MLLKDLFTELTSQLSACEVYIGHGAALAEDEVVLLLMSVLAVDFDTLNSLSDATVTNEQVSRAQLLLKQRIETRKPMAYMIGFSVFAGLRFIVDERVLIPRSPFAELIDRSFAPHLNIHAIKNALDLCTGGGCIGLALAHYFPHLAVDLADISPAALAVAELNRLALDLANRTNLIESDVWSGINKKYDLIVTNPPYVSATEYQDLPKEFSHEPSLALISEAQGLLIPVKILAQAADYLTSEGFLFLEVGYSDHLLQTQFADIDFNWLDFEYGGQGICVFKRQDLLKYQALFKTFLESHVA